MVEAYKDHIKQVAFENACDCLYYGMGGKYWRDMHWNQDLPEEESKEIWEKAFWYVAEGRI